jgi:dihydrofolate reductase
MRKIVFGMNCSLDGYIAGPNGEDDWALINDEMHDYSTRLLESGDIMLCGRVIYRMLADYWPTAEQDASLSPSVRRFAQTINRLPKILYSRSISSAGWNTRIEKTLVPEEILKMKQQPGKNLLVAGAALAHSLMELDLMDEVHLLIHPVILGAGRPMFERLKDRVNLKLLQTETLESGLVALSYQLVR